MHLLLTTLGQSSHLEGVLFLCLEKLVSAREKASTYQTLFIIMIKCLLDPNEMLGNTAVRELDSVPAGGGGNSSYRWQPNKARDYVLQD